MNWTSTTVPLWQVDLENYFRVGGAFQLKDVTTEEHMNFVKLFAVRHNLDYTLSAKTVLFSHKAAS
jgi:hypothetical protein